ncbi:MAG: Uma2 family endonuclease, partial [Chromatiaceae bacterium]|nr:Uma2 family endonuclease [Chromatiaceae bacterium]
TSMSRTASQVLPDGLEPAWDIARLFPPQGSWSEYAMAGIPEYWLIDPSNRTVTVFVLDTDKGRYVQHHFGESDRQAVSASLPGFVIDLRALFSQES